MTYQIKLDFIKLTQKLERKLRKMEKKNTLNCLTK